MNYSYNNFEKLQLITTELQLRL